MKVRAKALNFIRDGALRPLAVALMPAADAPANLSRWLAEEVEAALKLPGMANG
ncbi:MAG: hypothetical protein HY420_01525 [Candidatus Kerfeldbacteria bacterium]|nr:hypothetical protein [Candidatus Kerfeldbacteria bacterium]